MSRYSSCVGTITSEWMQRGQNALILRNAQMLVASDFDRRYQRRLLSHMHSLFLTSCRARKAQLNDQKMPVMSSQLRLKTASTAKCRSKTPSYRACKLRAPLRVVAISAGRYSSGGNRNLWLDTTFGVSIGTDEPKPRLPHDTFTVYASMCSTPMPLST